MHGESFVPAAAWALPFVGLLLAIAILPLAAPHFWDSNLKKLAVAGALALPVLALYAQVRPEALDTRRRTTSRSSSCSAACS
jgi:hypothetical protein